MQEIWVDRENFRKTKIVELAEPTLSDGEVLVSVDKIGGKFPSGRWQISSSQNAKVSWLESGYGVSFPWPAMWF